MFAERALSALVGAGHEVALVLTRPDQPAGRGQSLRASPVKQTALALGLPLAQPRGLRDPEVQRQLASVGAELMVVAAYGLILPQAVLDLPAEGCLNIHASLLPRWRGAAPIQRAIEAGDPETGITIMRMDAGLDTGDMLLAAAEPIRPDDNAARLHDRLAELGARLIVEALRRLSEGGLVATPQPPQGVTYAAKVLKSEAPLDWRWPARRLADRIRAFDPSPGSTAVLAGPAGEALKLWRAGLAAGPGSDDWPDWPAVAPPAPGSLCIDRPGRLFVACGDGWLELLEIQRPGGKRHAVADWLRGAGLDAGSRFMLSA